MGDPSKFQNIFLYYIFNISFVSLIFSEIFIFIYTNLQGSQKNSGAKADRGTKWLLYANFVFCMTISIYFNSQMMMPLFRNIKIPVFLSYFGIIFMVSGIVLRLIAVFTLNKAFTLNVQTTNCQHLVTSDVYHLIRNPAYTGSIISLLGISTALRNLPSILTVLLLCVISYSIRIDVEEKALQKRFKDEFLKYKQTTYKLIPFIW